MKKSPITTHILDTTRGKPAQGVPVFLEMETREGVWERLAQGETNQEGRIMDLISYPFTLTKGRYQLIFDTKTYFEQEAFTVFYPHVIVTFDIQHPSQHYHIPLLLSPYGYSTYRGS